MFFKSIDWSIRLHLLFHDLKRPPKKASGFVLPVAGQIVVFTAMYFDLLGDSQWKERENIWRKGCMHKLCMVSRCVLLHAIGLIQHMVMSCVEHFFCMWFDLFFFYKFPTSRLNHDPDMTGQKPGRTIRNFAKRIGEGVQSSSTDRQLRERNLARHTEDISGSKHIAKDRIVFESSFCYTAFHLPMNIYRVKNNMQNSIWKAHNLGFPMCHGCRNCRWRTVWSIHLPSIRSLALIETPEIGFFFWGWELPIISILK